LNAYVENGIDNLFLPQWQQTEAEFYRHPVNPAHLPKSYFFINRLPRACPTNGSGRGSLRSHDLTLFVRQTIM